MACQVHYIPKIAWNLWNPVKYHGITKATLEWKGLSFHFMRNNTRTLFFVGHMLYSLYVIFKIFSLDSFNSSTITAYWKAFYSIAICRLHKLELLFSNKCHCVNSRNFKLVIYSVITREHYGILPDLHDFFRATKLKTKVKIFQNMTILRGKKVLEVQNYQLRKWWDTMTKR